VKIFVRGLEATMQNFELWSRFFVDFFLSLPSFFACFAMQPIFLFLPISFPCLWQGKRVALLGNRKKTEGKKSKGLSQKSKEVIYFELLKTGKRDRRA